MIEILESTNVNGCEDYKLFFTFKMFGNDNIHSDNQIFESEKQAMSYLHQTKKQVFLHNFEKFITTLAEYVENDKQVTSINRLQAANNYFNETLDLTLQKICSMTIGVQNHLMAVMPSPKNKYYDKYFTQLNELIKFSKNEIKPNGSNIQSNPQKRNLSS